MKWKEHLETKGLHAMFGGSNYHWINYTDDEFVDRYKSIKAKEKGTELHAIAAALISNKIRLGNDKTTFSTYVNDAIRYRMDPEVHLYCNPLFFGTADALSFNKGLLRIHDLKTGKTPASMNQLFVYSAFFILDHGKELGIKATDISYELRIYQNDDIMIEKPDGEMVSALCNKINLFYEIARDIEED